MQQTRKSLKMLGSAYVIPLTQVEYKNHYGMNRDDEVEHIAIEIAMDFGIDQGWIYEDVGAENLGYDLRSVNPELINRYIEVKGRAAKEPVMISENKMNRQRQLGEAAWLYVVSHCKSVPHLFLINNPGSLLNYHERSK